MVWATPRALCSSSPVPAVGPEGWVWAVTKGAGARVSARRGLRFMGISWSSSMSQQTRKCRIGIDIAAPGDHRAGETGRQLDLHSNLIALLDTRVRRGLRGALARRERLKNVGPAQPGP